MLDVKNMKPAERERKNEGWSSSHDKTEALTKIDLSLFLEKNQHTKKAWLKYKLMPSTNYLILFLTLSYFNLKCTQFDFGSLRKFCTWKAKLHAACSSRLYKRFYLHKSIRLYVFKVVNSQSSNRKLKSFTSSLR